MSSYIVSKETIDYILNFVVKSKAWIYTSKKYEVDTDKELNKIGQILVNANYKSVNTRYNDHEKPYKYNIECPKNNSIDLVQVIKCIVCLDYQSCDVNTWNKSEAKKILNCLMWDIGTKLPSYEEATWGIN